MSLLADQLHHEHAIMLDVLKQLRTTGPATEAGHELLLKARSLIINHLQQEDDHIYPVLRANEFTHDIATNFSEEMGLLAQRFIDFFERYDAPDNTSEFSSELGRLLAILQKRISREEYVLLPTYKQLRISEENARQGVLDFGHAIPA